MVLKLFPEKLEKQAPGFEPRIRGLQPRALPLGHACMKKFRNSDSYKVSYILENKADPEGFEPTTPSLEGIHIHNPKGVYLVLYPN